MPNSRLHRVIAGVAVLGGIALAGSAAWSGAEERKAAGTGCAHCADSIAPAGVLAPGVRGDLVQASEVAERATEGENDELAMAAVEAADRFERDMNTQALVHPAAVYLLLDFIDQYAEETKSKAGSYPGYRHSSDAKLVSELLFRLPLWMKEWSDPSQRFAKREGASLIEFSAPDRIYFRSGPKVEIQVTLDRAARKASVLVQPKSGEPKELEVDLNDLRATNADWIRQRAWKKVQASLGMTPFDAARDSVPEADDDWSTRLNPYRNWSKSAQIKQLAIDTSLLPPVRVERADPKPPTKEFATRWRYVPDLLISYPVLKLQYDVPNAVTSTVVESIRRSPKDNARGALMQSKQAVKGVFGGVKRIAQGLRHPGRARLVDGLIDTTDAAVVKSANAGLSVVKTAASTVAYPIYRALGGSPSKHQAIRGKRAAIVLVESAIGLGPVEGLVDTYGELLVRNYARPISDYYCVVYYNDPDSSLEKCIDGIPRKIDVVDFYNLHHGGNMDRVDRAVRELAQKRGIRPGMVVTIGCEDPPSAATQRENTMGQAGTSWAVQYYFASALAKRNRGTPLSKGSKEAYYENMATNLVNPLSLLGMLATRGTGGSKPVLAPGDAGRPDLPLHVPAQPRTPLVPAPVQK